MAFLRVRLELGLSVPLLKLAQSLVAVLQHPILLTLEAQVETLHLRLHLKTEMTQHRAEAVIFLGQVSLSSMLPLLCGFKVYHFGFKFMEEVCVYSRGYPLSRYYLSRDTVIVCWCVCVDSGMNKINTCFTTQDITRYSPLIV